MFTDAYAAPNLNEDGLVAPRPVADWGPNPPRLVELITNQFRLVPKSGSHLYSYRYSLTPVARNLQEERLVLESVWQELERNLGAIVVRCPNHLFSTTAPPQSELILVGALPSGEQFEVLVKMLRTGHLTEGGDSDVVPRHVVKRLAAAAAGTMRYQKLGRRYFSQFNLAGPGGLRVFPGFMATLTPKNTEPMMQIDVMHRPESHRSVLDTAVAAVEELADAAQMPRDAFNFDDPEVCAEWQRLCLYKTVVSTYNTQMYRVKAVHFDKTPQEMEFEHRNRQDKTRQQMKLTAYYREYYEIEIKEMRQPLLEAFAEKDTEEIFLVPGLCRITGFVEGIRGSCSDKNAWLEAVRHAKIDPAERLDAITSIVKEELTRGMDGNVASPTPQSKVAQDWKVTVDTNPVKVDARVLGAPEISFSREKHLVKDGSFIRWLTNGLQCPARLDDWLFIYPSENWSTLDIWFRSLRDIAQGTFGMVISDPHRFCFSSEEDPTPILEDLLTPNRQMALIVLPLNAPREVYKRLKLCTCTKFPCISQVVRFETIKNQGKRKGMATVCKNIALQMNAKLGGPLWHVNLVAADNATMPFFGGDSLTMVIGIDVHEAPGAGGPQMGFAASVDANCAMYHSTAFPANEERCMRLQEALRDAMVRFSRRNDGVLPDHILVYRGSVDYREWEAVRTEEVKAILMLTQSIDAMSMATDSHTGEHYKPELTFVAITKRVGMRFFQSSEDGLSAVRQVEPGTVVDSQETGCYDAMSFFLVSQAVAKGTAVPTQYVVLYHSGTDSFPAAALQHLTYRLSMLYYNCPFSVRLPAPAQYARKIAQLTGYALGREPHRRLRGTLFYL